MPRQNVLYETKLADGIRQLVVDEDWLKEPLRLMLIYQINVCSELLETGLRVVQQLKSVNRKGKKWQVN